MIQIVYVCEYNLTFWLIKNFIINQWGEKKNNNQHYHIWSSFFFFSCSSIDKCVKMCYKEKKGNNILLRKKEKNIPKYPYFSPKKRWIQWNQIYKTSSCFIFFHWTFFKFNDLVGYFLRMWMWCDAYFFTDDDLYLKNCWWWSRCCCYNFLLPFFLWLK